MEQSLSEPAIVILAYNRPQCLKRLLNSLERATYPKQPVVLVISVDQSDVTEVMVMAENFVWSHGPKTIVAQKTRLGLREQVLQSGDLTARYGSIVLLEDDLIVSRHFYQYARQALKFYEADCQVAGVSLYSYGIHPYYWANDYGLQFTPLNDGFDNYFVRYGASWGQAYNRNQWSAFRQWLSRETPAIMERPPLPPKTVRGWPESSWKKYFIKYMIETKRFFVFPRISLSTNGGDIGVHFGHPTLRWQVPLLAGNREWRFSSLPESCSRYDSHFEIESSCLKKLNPQLEQFHFETDLTGIKLSEEVESEYLLTFRRAGDAVLSFGSQLNPVELNIVHGIEGNHLSLVTRKNWELSLKDPMNNTSLPTREQFRYFFNQQREAAAQVPNQGILQEILDKNEKVASQSARTSELEAAVESLKQTAAAAEARHSRKRRRIRGRLADWLT